MACKFLRVIILAVCFTNCNNQQPLNSKLSDGFINPSDSIQTSVYWYWISDNISKEGVVNDLHSMKKAGINRAFIGNIGQDGIPYGKVKMLSDEWWEVLHVALKTASELGIDIGIFNSPGWSQSGGPWVKPEEAMRYLASSEILVKGPQKVSVKLKKPNEIFQDVKTIAFQAPKDYNSFLKASDITRISGIQGAASAFDENADSGFRFIDRKETTIEVDTKSPFVARSLVIYPLHRPLRVNAIFSVKENDEWKVIAEFDMDRSNTALNVGFEPYAPVTVSFPSVTASSYRITFLNANPGSGIAEIKLSSSPRVERFSEKTLAKMHPTPLPYWRDYLWRKQPELDDNTLTINSSKVIDVSKYLTADGALNWEVPDGEWVILRTGMTPTGTKNSPASPEATGLEVDKMSREHARKHFYGHMGEILKRIPEADRKSFKVVVQDSYETGGQNFTDDFIEEFKQRFGYDPVPFFPVYWGRVVNSQRESDAFLWDVRRMIADKVAYDYVGGLRDVSHEHGLTTWLENYGHWGFPGEFLMYGGQSDEIGGEFWSEGELGDIENRAATSCGHIYGKNKISAESNTCAGAPFARYPAVIKQRGDRFFAEGINNTLLHVYITQPYENKNPGVNAWFGNEFNRKNTWFSQMDSYTLYLKRANYMLQQGLNIADVAYFIGEDAPKMTGIAEPALPVGYQFDYINAEVIEKYMTVKDGLLTLPHGTQYRIMVLPNLETIRPELLKKIKHLVEEGGVIMGSAPLRSPSLQNQPEADRQVKLLATELWGDVGNGVRQIGKGKILNGMTMEEAFREINCVPDCNLPEDRSIHYGHRTTANGEEIYFISNQTDKLQIVTPVFRVKGLQPELWEPVTGYIRDLPSFVQDMMTTSVPLQLEPYESAFIVFREKANNGKHGDVKHNFPDPVKTLEIAGPWDVQFDHKQRGPERVVVFDKLMDWTSSTNDSIKYYSGTANYTTTFNLEGGSGHEQSMLDLGKLTAMAKVYVNGKYAGGVWTEPYRVNISDFVRIGENQLKVEVVNTWVNRLIGDQNLPEKERKTWCPVNGYQANSPLQPSGLFGPVVIKSYN